MKVLLFDDTPQDYREKYVNLSDYHDILTLIGPITRSEFEAIRDVTTAADCILIHRSFRDADNLHRNDVYEEVRDIADMGDKIPLVIFSGEDNEEAVFDGDTYIERFNKTDLYENLPFFLDTCKKSNTIDLRSLAHGKRIGSKLATNDVRTLIMKTRRLAPDEPFDSAIVEGVELNDLVQRSMPCLGCAYSDIIKEIKDKRITAAEFIRRITEILESINNNYGKNLYRWGN